MLTTERSPFRTTRSEIYGAALPSLIPMPQKVAYSDSLDHEDEHATKIGALRAISQQLADVERARREQEDLDLRLEQRIKNAEIAHGQQL